MIQSIIYKGASSIKVISGSFLSRYTQFVIAKSSKLEVADGQEMTPSLGPRDFGKRQGMTYSKASRSVIYQEGMLGFLPISPPPLRTKH
jgi:hypothetical protein